MKLGLRLVFCFRIKFVLLLITQMFLFNFNIVSKMYLFKNLKIKLILTNF